MHQSMATLLLSLGILILGMEAVKKAFVSSMAWFPKRSSSRGACTVHPWNLTRFSPDGALQQSFLKTQPQSPPDVLRLAMSFLALSQAEPNAAINHHDGDDDDDDDDDADADDDGGSSDGSGDGDGDDDGVDVFSSIRPLALLIWIWPHFWSLGSTHIWPKKDMISLSHYTFLRQIIVFLIWSYNSHSYTFPPHNK